MVQNSQLKQQKGVSIPLGRLGDTFLDPIWWVPVDIWTSIGIRAGEAVNDVSLRIGEYEALKEAAIDPYAAAKCLCPESQ